MRALVADDDRATAAILQKALERWGIEVIVAHDGETAWQHLHSITPPSLAIVDWMMPGLNGVEVCRRLRSTPRLEGLYTILLTSRDGREDLVRGLDAGADDYMVKPIELEELRARVHVGLRVARLQQNLAERVAELQATRDHLARLANIDSLTEVYSRRGWFDHSMAELSRCRRYDRTLSLMVVDLDLFKTINDTYGHHAGDAVLRRFADMLRVECRQSDIIGRLGGEEFGLVLPETPVESAQCLATRITNDCRLLNVETSAGVVKVSCSIGLTGLHPEDESVESVLRRADTALYDAKRSGRGRWRLAA